jgi:hypothetical protein
VERGSAEQRSAMSGFGLAEMAVARYDTVKPGRSRVTHTANCSSVGESLRIRRGTRIEGGGGNSEAAEIFLEHRMPNRIQSDYEQPKTSRNFEKTIRF